MTCKFLRGRLRLFQGLSLFQSLEEVSSKIVKQYIIRKLDVSLIAAGNTRMW